jgi:hypothetical protein
MADRNICCTQCSANLGTIRDAKLRKDIVYFCQKCLDLAVAKIASLEKENTAMRHAEQLRKIQKSKSPYDDMFGDIFGGR